MHRIRRFEEAAEKSYIRGLSYGTMHLSIGQEATAVGVCISLSDADFITSTHRGHGHCIAKGAQLTPMFAEFLGRETGYCRGRGGSMHIAEPARGNLGANGIVGGGLPIAVGAALSAKKRQTGAVAVAFFGDGADDEGVFHDRSTSPRYGSCRSFSSARTTNMRCPRPFRARRRSPTSPIVQARTACPH